MDCSPPGSYVHGILQARILVWVARSFARGSSQLRDQTYISCLLHWQVGSLALTPPGKPRLTLHFPQMPSCSAFSCIPPRGSERSLLWKERLREGILLGLIKQREKPTGFGFPRRHLASLQYWEQTTWNRTHRVTELAFPQIILGSWSPAPWCVNMVGIGERRWKIMLGDTFPILSIFP